MPALSKTKKIELLSKILQKRFKGLPAPPERQVLEHLIYAALLENATFDRADSAYAVLDAYFIDWNEIRVSTVAELADTFSILPDPMAAGERVRKALQGVFERTYMFDLEELRKKGKSLGQATEFLNSLDACSRFMVDYTTQVAFGGHIIPQDEATLRIFRRLGLAQVNKDDTREEVPGLERAVPKKNGLTFSGQLHHFAAGYFGDPDSEELVALLKTIDGDANKRDWAPPVLAVPKAPAPPSKPVPPIAHPVVIPFVAPDDDDFEEDPAGTEAEFIPEEGDLASPPAEKKKKDKGPAAKKPAKEVHAREKPAKPPATKKESKTPPKKKKPK